MTGQAKTVKYHELSKQGMWKKTPAEAVRRLGVSKLVLDVGCGTGRHMTYDSVGVDNDPRALVQAKLRGHVVLADAHNLPFRPVFELSILWNVLNFVDDPNKVYQEADSVARQDPFYNLTNWAKNARWIISLKNKTKLTLQN